MGQIPRIRILHVEDNAPDAELIALTLQDSGLNCDIRLARSLNECRTALAEGGYQLVLSDSHSHDFRGRDILHLVREYLPGVPFIFLSGSFDDTDPVLLHTEGAADCLLKDELRKLAPTVRRVLGI
ncbi:MAG TPA: response regulator [Gammaproteobacteria bacterium]|nr:response regulator [Gammaproteobacteria bacterium]